MSETIHLSAVTFTIISAVVGILLGLISWLLLRLISSFDENFKNLTVQVAKLNETMVKIDKDSVAIQLENTHMQEKVDGLEPLWDRMRKVEQDVAVIQERGCDVYFQCRQH